jgi:hypothetical protein
VPALVASFAAGVQRWRRLPRLSIPRLKSRGAEEIGSVRWVLAYARQSVERRRRRFLPLDPVREANACSSPPPLRRARALRRVRR